MRRRADVLTRVGPIHLEFLLSAVLLIHEALFQGAHRLLVRNLFLGDLQVIV